MQSLPPFQGRQEVRVGKQWLMRYRLKIHHTGDIDNRNGDVPHDKIACVPENFQVNCARRKDSLRVIVSYVIKSSVLKTK